MRSFSGRPRTRAWTKRRSGLRRFGKVIRARYTNTYDRPGRSLSSLLDGAAARHAAGEWQSSNPGIVHVNKQNLEDGLDLLHATRLLPGPSVCTIHITQSAAFLGAKGAWLRDAVARRGLRSYGGTIGRCLRIARGGFAELSWGYAATWRRFPTACPCPPVATAAH